MVSSTTGAVRTISLLVSYQRRARSASHPSRSPSAMSVSRRRTRAVSERTASRGAWMCSGARTTALVATPMTPPTTVSTIVR